jgi:flavin-dependent dehydrogenase
MHFDESFDVIVVGSGLAGGIAATTAADAGAGAKVLLIEKSEVPGGRARAHARPGAVHATT